MSAQQFEQILDRYLHGLASEEEIRLVDHWYQSFDYGSAGDAGTGPSGETGGSGELRPDDLRRGMASGLAAIRAATDRQPAGIDGGSLSAIRPAGFKTPAVSAGQPKIPD